MKIVATEKAPKALGPYSQGYVHNGVLYTAGQIAINPEVNDVEATTIEAHSVPQWQGGNPPCLWLVSPPYP